MKEITLRIMHEELEAFKYVVGKLDDVEFLGYHQADVNFQYQVRIEYKHEHTLFYMGSMMRTATELEKL